MKLFADITKIDREQRMVFGYASTEVLDSQGEIVRKEALEAALPGYMRFANIREMHQPSAVGVAKEAEIDGKGLYLAARIVDDEAWAKVVEGVYKGFSIGGKVTARDPVAKNIITGVDLLEISLVDRPANPEAVIELYKAARREPKQIWDCGIAGHQHLAKAGASQCIAAAATIANQATVTPPAPSAAVENEVGGRARAADRVGGPSSAAGGQGTAAIHALGKGMESVGDFAGILGDIEELHADTAAEAKAEGDGSELPAQLKAWLDEGAALLRAMVAEETEEMTSNAYDGYPDYDDYPTKRVAKVGARHSKVDLARVQQVHDTAVALGARCPSAAKAAHIDALAKRDDAFRQIVEPLVKSVADLTRRLAIVEAQPLPAKGVAKIFAVGKEQDTGTAAGESVDSYVQRLSGMSAEKRAYELTKLALRFPQPLTR